MAPDRNAASRNAASIAGVRGVCAVRPGSGVRECGVVRRRQAGRRRQWGKEHQGMRRQHGGNKRRQRQAQKCPHMGGRPASMRRVGGSRSQDFVAPPVLAFSSTTQLRK